MWLSPIVLYQQGLTYFCMRACCPFFCNASLSESYNWFEDVFEGFAHFQVSWAVLAWGVNFTVMWLLVRMMMLGVPPSPLDILAYSGYSFVSFCLSTICGWAFGSGLGWHAAWVYTSACMSIFLIRTFKQIMRIDAANRGESNGGALRVLRPICQCNLLCTCASDCLGLHAGRHRMYLLLGMGGAQFVVSWIMGATVHVKAMEQIEQ